jgi:hypothetical protein
MCGLEKKLKVRSFFVMDENFLLNKTRTLRLLELMEQNRKSWTFLMFSSAKVIQSYTDDQLIRLGISWLWMGLEGKQSRYSKLDGIDTKELVTHLQSLGIRVLGSTIIGLEDHTPENIDQAIDWAVDHKTVFHQFMLYTPLPGTPLYEEHKKNGTILSEEECAPSDTHGQYKFNYRHPNIKNHEETEFLIRAFTRDFTVNGPSLMRLIGAMLSGWKTLKNHPDPCVRDRAAWEFGPIKSTYASGLRAMKYWYSHDAPILKEINRILKGIYEEFGWKTRLLSTILAPVIYSLMRREEKRLAGGWTYEPTTKCTMNEAARELYQTGKKLPVREVQETLSKDHPLCIPTVS